ncbi:sodium:proton antiporter [Mycetocola spongiae]|nr:sodium:proton antiporter [Mycetocola spongiae]
MTVILWIIVAMFGASALCAVYRILTGPTLLDRVVASDVLVATIMCSLGAEMAINRHTNTLPVMLVLAMFAIVGSVSVARFMSNQAEA